MAALPSFNPANWYWTVAGDQTRAFSSASGDYVPANNATFAAWRAAGNAPSKIVSEAELGQVLAPYLIRPITAGILDGYQDDHATKIIAQAYFKVIFNHENRIRTIERALALNGSPANLTAAQTKAAVKALM